MKAVLLTGHGGPEMLRSAKRQIRQRGQAKSSSTSMLPASTGQTRKYGVAMAAISSIIFHTFLAATSPGVVSAVGAGVTDFKMGDAVFGVTDQGIEGTYAEKIAINAAIIAKKPDRLGHSEAAALGLTSLTALTAIEDTAQLKAGQTVLIHGGAGGVAGFAIQLAKHLGAKVITTASAGNHPYVRSLGADQAMDYNAEDFTKIGPICDMVFDTVGGDVQARSYAVLKPGGKLVWIAPAPKDLRSARGDVQTLRPNVIRDRAHLERMLGLARNQAQFGHPRSSGISSQTPPKRTG